MIIWTQETIERNGRLFESLPVETQAEIRERVSERDPLREMARVGTVGDFFICVYDGEGPVPHFHVKNRKTREEACVKLLSAEYFNHSSKRMTLNSNERRELCKFLSSRTITSALTNYQAICLMWNTNNPDHRINKDPRDMRMPDYRNM